MPLVVGPEQRVHVDCAVLCPVLGSLQLFHSLQQLLALKACTHVGHLALLLQLCTCIQQRAGLLCLILDLVQQLVALVHVPPFAGLHLYPCST